MNNDYVAKTAAFVKEKFSQESTGHDWWHMYRVWQLSKRIAQLEKDANLLVVELAALLHDIADWKFHDGDTEIGPRMTREWLESLRLDKNIVKQVTYIVQNISYKGGTNKHVMQTIEGRIVQDADRLDAMGAIGIARTFAFGGTRGREMYNPDIAPKSYNSFEDFQEHIDNNTTINHFYEKLLLLKDTMHTETGKQLAAGRHKYMEQYLKEFYAEWEGEL